MDDLGVPHFRKQPHVATCFWGIKSLNKSDVIKKGLHLHYLPEIVHGWKCHEDSMLKRQCIYKSGRFQPAIGNSGRSLHTPDEHCSSRSYHLRLRDCLKPGHSCCCHEHVPNWCQVRWRKATVGPCLPKLCTPPIQHDHDSSWHPIHHFPELSNHHHHKSSKSS